MKNNKAYLFCALLSAVFHIIVLLYSGKLIVANHVIKAGKINTSLEVSLKEKGNRNGSTKEKDNKISKMHNNMIYDSGKAARKGINDNNEKNNNDSSNTGDEIGEGNGNGSANSGIIMAKPDYNYNPKPIYPIFAKKSGYEGKVYLKVKVLENGFVGMVTILASSGYSILDNAAKGAVYKWKFFPALKNGRPFECWVNVPIRFELE